MVGTRIDWPARSMHDLQIIVATLKDTGAHLAGTEQPVDTSTAAGKAFFDMLGVFAEFETNLRRATNAGAKESLQQTNVAPVAVVLRELTWKLSGNGSPTANRPR